MSQGKFGDNYCLGVIRPSFNSISHQIASKWSVGGGWEQTACSAWWRSPRGPLPPGRTCAVWLEEPDWVSLRAETNRQLIRSFIHLCLSVSLCPSRSSILADLTTTQGWGLTLTIKYCCVAIVYFVYEMVGSTFLSMLLKKVTITVTGMVLFLKVLILYVPFRL